MKNALYLTSKALFVLKIFKILSWLFDHVRKTAGLERYGYVQNQWHHKLVNRQLQYAYCLISDEVKATRQWNLVD